VAHLNNFTFGWFTLVFAYVVSVTGSLLGLLCTVRAQQFRSTGQHVRWLILAAIAIGGAGIWLMHFSAMIGFSVSGSDLRYGIVLTAVSALIAIAVVGCGLFVAGYGTPSPAKLVVGGVFTGLGVAGMHYMGMAAMRVEGRISYNVPLVILSALIAIAAATVALWFTVSLRTWGAITAGALIMGVAVCGMHYTGMAALRVRLTPSLETTVTGIDPMTFMVPVLVIAFIVLTVLLLSVILGPTSEDIEIRDRLFDVPHSPAPPYAYELPPADARTGEPH
jgi:NO-binding membrane sensor protein with MHYT domain